MQVALENEQALSAYVSRADTGEEVVLTRAGRTVARIVTEQPLKADAEQAEAAERLIALYEKGYDLGGLKINRDELYDRDR